MADYLEPRWLTHVPDEAIARGDGELAIEFAEAFGVITKDSVAGQMGTPIKLREWQKDVFRRILAKDEFGNYRQRLNIVSTPRKNGKSAMGSLIALFHLYLGVKGGEIYSLASDKDQARIVFSDTRKMVEANPELMGLAKLYRDAIELPSTGSVYRVRSSEDSTAEGYSPTATIYDEGHSAKNRKLFDVFQLAMGSRPSAQMVMISTAGVKTDQTGSESLLYSLKQYGEKVARGEVEDNSFHMSWWEAPIEADYKDPETWKMANPGFDDICSATDFESAVRRTQENEFRTKRLNQFVSSQSAWLPQGAWDNRATEFELDPEQEYVLGFDGSFSGDATVIVGCTIPKGEEIPAIFMVKTWEKDENIHDQDWRVNIQEVEQTIIDFVAQNPKCREIACDPYRWQRSMEALADRGLPIVEFPSTSARRMIPACASLYDAIVDERMIQDGDPTLARHIDNAVVKTDNLGTRIVKDSRASQRRIDAAVAAVIAFSRATSGKMEEELIPQVFI
jgi:phage terminase large subunit-like protein